MAVKDACSGDPQPSAPVVSWGLAPDLSRFYGRAADLATLKQWVLGDRCRLITLLGLQGVGKTDLATKLAEQLQSEFKVIIWRSLQTIGQTHAPLPFDDFLNDLMSHLTPDLATSISGTIAARVRQFITRLSQIPCLLIFDNVESVL